MNEEFECMERIYIGEEDILKAFYELLAETELELSNEIFNDIFNSMMSLHNGYTTDLNYAKSIKHDIDIILCFLMETEGLHKTMDYKI